MKSKMIKEYVKPVRIIKCSDNIKNADALILNNSSQVFFNEPELMECKGKGYVILDFGVELHGGVRIMTSYYRTAGNSPKVRIRFGESVGETCVNVGEKGAVNDHAVRDMEVIVPTFSDQEWGQTGFRFVRFDFLDEKETYRIINIYAAFIHRDMNYIGSFECSDALVNEIYNTARYTVFLNMQQGLWDGIKRDRLIWLGDMYPEVLAVTDIWGADECVEKSVQMSVDKTPLPNWFGNIPTYSGWYIQIICEYYMKTGNEEFARGQLSYIEGVLEQISTCIGDDGTIDYSSSPVDDYFFDWPTKNTEDAKKGNRYIYIFMLENLQKLYADLGETEPDICKDMLLRLRRKKESLPGFKQVAALGFISGEIAGEDAKRILEKGGAHGLSTFMSYFILRALWESGNPKDAVSVMKEYYGGMLERGATTFWEDFDIDWLKNSGRIDEPTPEGKLDLHGDFGNYCYKGFRHSLCHGWSCGPVSFLTEKVLGVQVTKSGCREITIKPNLAGMSWARGIFPTPYGQVSIEHKMKNGKIVTKINAPKEVTVNLQSGDFA